MSVTKCFWNAFVIFLAYMSSMWALFQACRWCRTDVRVSLRCGDRYGRERAIKTEIPNAKTQVWSLCACDTRSLPFFEVVGKLLMQLLALPKTGLDDIQSILRTFSLGHLRKVIKQGVSETWGSARGWLQTRK